MQFKNFINESRSTQEKIALMLYMVENDDLINESYNLEKLSEDQEEALFEDIKSWMKKVGLNFEKKDGLIDYLAQFSIGAGKIILAAIKGDKEKVKQIAASLTRAKIVDFLLKLDVITLHIITEPIHIIDAVTGWELMADIERAAFGVSQQVKIFHAALKQVKDSVTRMLTGKSRTKTLQYVSKLNNSIPNK